MCADSDAAAAGDPCAREVAYEVYKRTCCGPRIGAGLPAFTGELRQADIDMTPNVQRKEHALFLAQGYGMGGWLAGLDHVRLSHDTPTMHTAMLSVCSSFGDVANLVQVVDNLATRGWGMHVELALAVETRLRRKVRPSGVANDVPLYMEGLFGVPRSGVDAAVASLRSRRITAAEWWADWNAR